MIGAPFNGMWLGGLPDQVIARLNNDKLHGAKQVTRLGYKQRPNLKASPSLLMTPFKGRTLPSQFNPDQSLDHAYSVL